MLKLPVRVQVTGKYKYWIPEPVVTSALPSLSLHVPPDSTLLNPPRLVG